MGGTTSKYYTVEYHRNLYAPNISYDLQTSSNLKSWSTQSPDLVYLGSHNNGDGTATVTSRSASAITQLGQRIGFIRLRVGTY